MYKFQKKLEANKLNSVKEKAGLLESMVKEEKIVVKINSQNIARKLSTMISKKVVRGKIEGFK